MKTTLLLALLAPSFLFAAPSTGWRGIGSMEFELADFPVEGSAEYKKDFEVLLKWQEERSPEQCRQGRRMKWPEFKTLFKTELLDPEEMALVTPLMNQLQSFTERVSGYHKDKFERLRPYDADARIKPCADKAMGAKAYPSSHAAISSAISCVLSEVFPVKAEDLKAFGQELGDLRVVIGLHHPSDVKAGQKLGFEICDRLMSEPDFKEEVESLKKSLSQSPH